MKASDWGKLKVGDVIYDAQPRWGDTDYHKMIIDTIDLDELKVTAHDETGQYKGILSHFLTEEEFKNLR